MTTQITTKRASRILFVVLIAACCGATVARALAQGQAQAKARPQYQVSNLASLGPLLPQGEKGEFRASLAANSQRRRFAGARRQRPPFSPGGD